MKSFLLVLALLPLLAFVSCERKEFAPVSQKAQTLISLTESGKVEVWPNEGILVVEIACSHMNLQKSKECVTGQDMALRKAYAALGIPDSMIAASQIKRQKEYDWLFKGGKTLKGYATKKGIQVEVVGLDKLDMAIDSTLGVKDAQLFVQYTHTQLDSLQNVAYLDAVARLQKRASEIQKSIGLGNCKILSIADKPIGVSAGVDAQAVSDMGFENPRKRDIAIQPKMNLRSFSDPGKMTIAAEASMLLGCD
jgi:uncharacterized protein YggE